MLPHRFSRFLIVLSILSWDPALARIGKSWQPFLVKLWKEHSMNSSRTGDNKTVHHGSNHGSGYFVGKITIGQPHPQEMHVAFTTSAGMFVLPSATCETVTCQHHRRYNPQNSSTSVDVQLDGRPVDPAGGRRAPPNAKREGTALDFAASDSKADGGLKGVIVQDEVCFGDRIGTAKGELPPSCATVSVVVAMQMDENTFSTLPEDGLVGLGLSALSPHNTLNFIGRLGQAGLKQQFGLYVADDASEAELTFGGWDASRMETSPLWVPVADPSLGHWMMDVVEVQVGGVPLKMCRENLCRGFVHTSSPRMMIPKSVTDEWLEAIGKYKPSQAIKCDLPEVSFKLATGDLLVLRREDYAGPGCEPEFTAHPMGKDIAGGADILIFGEPFLRRYYTVFDWEQNKLGFANALVERSCPRLAEAGIPDAAGCGGSGGSGDSQDAGVLGYFFSSSPSSQDHQEA
eukprot:TRINITY_DN39367_c0_g1_i1.p1 TRINITY_DN39367_c0_g1~~TRINITY_DN39367_c0_g1_i1.p1  ORF type:complete len:459 (+),score=91.11 TRINITY_DN39367_c0_g1_i1:32-1408(+)